MTTSLQTWASTGYPILNLLPFDVMLPAVGQGALAIQCRRNDERTRELDRNRQDQCPEQPPEKGCRKGSAQCTRRLPSPRQRETVQGGGLRRRTPGNAHQDGGKGIRCIVYRE